MHTSRNVEGGTRTALAAIALGCAADATEEPDQSRRGDCKVVEAFPLDVDSGCFSSKVTLGDVCLREEQPETTSGLASSACLIGPSGNVYYVGAYGYTQTLEGDGWNAYDVDPQASVASNEHIDTPFPPSCNVGREAMNTATERCAAQFDGDYEACIRPTGEFTPAMEGALESSCDSSLPDASGP